MMSVRNRWLVGVGCFAAVAAGAAGWWVWRSPPGKWQAAYSNERMWTGWQKEQEWLQQEFAPIHDDSGFYKVVEGLTTHVLAPVPPDQMDKLRRILHDQLVCRHSGSLVCYRERFARDRANPMNEFNRERVDRLYAGDFDLPEDWQVEPVFERFWDKEYGDHRFKEIAVGQEGSLIAVGQARDVAPEFFSEEELSRLNAWPGASLRRSIQFHPGTHTLESLIERDGEVTYAQVAMIIRSINDEVWCWNTDWYFDPTENRWELQVSIAVTLRGPYYCPI